MLSSPQLAHLVEGSSANRALCGGFLPTNNNTAFSNFEDIYTVTIVDTDGKSPIAFGAMNMYSVKQAYCMVGEVAEKYENSTIWLDDVSTVKNHTILKISRCEEGKPNHNGLGMFIAVFGEHDEKPVEEFLMEWMVNKTIGNNCLDLTKNVTLDVVGNRNLTGWRDNAGFMVSDNQRYVEVTCKRKDIESLTGASATEISAISDANKETLIEYDSQCTMIDRSEYLNALLKVNGVNGVIAFDEHKQPLGYALRLGTQILSCYANSEETARQLLSFIAASISDDEITFYTTYLFAGFMDELISKATSITPVRIINA
ncbi:unnamed protein product, partial [Mesorhabditis belari]|uniref:DUF7596 domain-containing protein n=1 Tax=Mesorhabditis belari TaxID=2138241 RepID=A0AAF3JAR8_9BILA